MNTTPNTSLTTARRLGTNRRRHLVAGLALAATGLLASCSGVGATKGGEAAAPVPADKKVVVAQVPVVTASDDAADPAALPVSDLAPASGDQGSPDQGSSNQGNGSGSGSNSGQGGGSGQGNGAPAPAAPSQPSAPAPTITSFTTPENIDCHNGNFQTFTASWSTKNATKVTISIDGPGVYKTYPANGSDSLPFNCSSAHTFLLTAYGHNGQKATRSITLQPRNVQVADPTDDQDEDQAPAAPAAPAGPEQPTPDQP